MNSVKHKLAKDTIRQTTNANKTLIVLRKGSDATQSHWLACSVSHTGMVHMPASPAWEAQMLLHAEDRGGMGSSLPVIAHRE